jgi:hypothetical protein
MGIDIRFPIGLMFSIFGIILTFYGLITRNDISVYTRSLGLNVNLWSGMTMLIFGGIMLIFVFRARKVKSK